MHYSLHVLQLHNSTASRTWKSNLLTMTVIEHTQSTNNALTEKYIIYNTNIISNFKKELKAARQH